MTKLGKLLMTAVGGTALAAMSACSGSNESESDSAANTAVAAPDAAAPAATDQASPAATPVAYADLTGDAVKGARVFLQCKTCHVLEAGQNRVGPSLNAIIGRTAGQVAGFNYSQANKNSGLVWTEETLFEYLEDPRKKVPGTKMIFAGLKAPQDRADVIAYLKENAQ